jgi:hypothetical protein
MSTTTSNVVPINESTPTTNPMELKLVRKCVDCGASMAADDACFQIDPDGNSTTAHVACSSHVRRAAKLLSEITKRPARTADGLQAKANLAERLFAWKANCMLGDEEVRYLEAFTADVVHFLEAERQRNDAVRS